MVKEKKRNTKTHLEHQHQFAGRSYPSSAFCGYDRQGTEDRPWRTWTVELWHRQLLFLLCQTWLRVIKLVGFEAEGEGKAEGRESADTVVVGDIGDRFDVQVRECE